MSTLFSRDQLDAARRVVADVFSGTPQLRWPLLAERTGTDIWVKHENHAPTGAFKIRGGLVHLAKVAREQSAPRGVITQTRGNHGQSVALAAARHSIPVTIVVPRGNSAEKNAAMRAFGARLIEHGDDFDAARMEAERLADLHGLRPIPSFHPDLVLGVATWASEFFSAVPALDALYVPIGLGSSICGAIGVRDLLGLKTDIIGVQSDAASAYARSLDAGRSVTLDSAATKADGLAVRIPDADALSIIARGAARIVTVTDDEIAEAIRAYWHATHNLAEGAGAAPLAAVMKERRTMAGRRVGVVLSGGNIDMALFERWVLGR